MAFVLTMAVATTAVGIEMLEALAIVLAVGVERRMRDALIGAFAAVVAVVALCAAVGPALLSGADLSSLRVTRSRTTPRSRTGTGRPGSLHSRASSWRASRSG